MSKTRVVILAAGKGTRMKASVPKPLVQIAGKPIIVHLLERVKKAGILANPVVVVAPDTQEIFQKTLGKEVDFAIQHEQLGTGDALRSAEAACQDAERVIVLYGDHPFIGEETIRELDRLSAEHPNSLVMLTAMVPNFEGQYETFKSWGRILHDNQGRVLGIREVKGAPESILAIKEVNPSIYAFPAPWIWKTLPKIKNENEKKEYYLTDIVGLAMEEGVDILTTQVDPLAVIGVNTPEELQRAESIYQQGI